MNQILNGKSNPRLNCDVKYEGNNNKNIEKDRKTHFELERPEQIKPKEKVINDDDVIKNEKNYLLRENDLTFSKYGKNFFELCKENEPKFLIPANYLDRHSLTPEAREKMIDWMVEVFSANNSEPGTLELAVHIMDTYILNTEKTLKDSDIHLLGLCSIYIASKMEEKIPMRLYHIVKYIGQNEFTSKEIIEKEKEILMTIDFDFFSAGTYDYLMTFFWDLKVNNEINLLELKSMEIIDKFIDFCVFISKLTLFDYEFASYDPSVIATTILSFTHDFFKENDKLGIKPRRFLRDWIYYLVVELGISTKDMRVVYQKIYDLYKKDILVNQHRYEDGDEEVLNHSSYLYKLYAYANYI